MADEGTPAEPIQEATAAPEGTTVQGQPDAAPTDGFDAISAQADYTRKTQELAEQRQQFEAERQQYEQQRSQYQQQPQQQQPQQDPNAGLVNQVVEQFGYEGAQTIGQLMQSMKQQQDQQLYESQYRIEALNGRNKYGESWDKHSYTDINGAQRNKVVDLMAKGLSVEQAWNASNPVDPAKIQQEAHNKALADLQSKEQATPAAATNTNPSAPATGHAKSIAEAFEQAKASG